jgi:hypothetical protein
VTLEIVQAQMLKDREHWSVHLMDFVDEFRRDHDPRTIEHPPQSQDVRLNALMAATVDYLCNEAHMKAPAWVDEVPPCPEPWFVSGMESLKAIALTESPAPFRARKIFVLENFLSRV